MPGRAPAHPPPPKQRELLGAAYVRVPSPFSALTLYRTRTSISTSSQKRDRKETHLSNWENSWRHELRISKTLDMEQQKTVILRRETRRPADGSSSHLEFPGRGTGGQTEAEPGQLWAGDTGLGGGGPGRPSGRSSRGRAQGKTAPLGECPSARAHERTPSWWGKNRPEGWAGSTPGSHPPGDSSCSHQPGPRPHSTQGQGMSPHLCSKGPSKWLWSHLTELISNTGRIKPFLRNLRVY